MKIYVSSKLKHRQMWLDSGIKTISSWVTQDPSRGYDEMWERYLLELRQCSVLLGYIESNETPKGMLLEIGAALANGARVVIVHPQILSDELEGMLGSIVHSGRVTIVPSLEEAKAFLRIPQ